MIAITDNRVTHIASFDEDAVHALQTILAEPAIASATTAAEYAAGRIAALREALHYISHRRLAAGAIESDEVADVLAVDLMLISPDLSAALRWHRKLAPLLGSLPPSRSRNAVIGDIRRGSLLTWARTTQKWVWHGPVPTEAHPLGRATATFVVDTFPGLYDAIVLWDSVTDALVVVPTHAEGLSWRLANAGWRVSLSNVCLHSDELITAGVDPRLLPKPGLDRERRAVPAE